jgi:hypothetical protein
MSTGSNTIFSLLSAIAHAAVAELLVHLQYTYLHIVYTYINIYLYSRYSECKCLADLHKRKYKIPLTLIRHDLSAKLFTNKN